MGYAEPKQTFPGDIICRTYAFALSALSSAREFCSSPSSSVRGFAFDATLRSCARISEFAMAASPPAFLRTLDAKVFGSLKRALATWCVSS